MISVCLATYNGSIYVQQQLRSVLAQLGPHDEVVVADDGSTDDTLALIIALEDSRLRLLEGGQHLGVVRNFERALSTARGDTIFLCDQDDIWLPGKVERCMEALSDSVLVVTDCSVVDGELNLIAPSFFRLQRSRSGVFCNLWRNNYLGCCMALRRDVLLMALPFPKNIAIHDWWIGLVAELLGAVCFLDQPLILYRRHGGNASLASTRSTFSLVKQIRWRIDMLRYLVIKMYTCSVFKFRNIP